MNTVLLAALAAPAKATAGAALAPAKAGAPIKATAGAVQPPPLQVQPGINYAHQTVFQTHFGWLTHTLGGLFIISALMLVALLALQTTKQEGLSGSIGGAVQSAYGRPGAEEQLKRITGVMAVSFVVLGTILSLTGI